MKLSYKNNHWDINNFTSIKRDDIKNLRDTIKKNVKTNEYKALKDERKQLIQHLLNYLKAPWFLNNPLREDKRKIAYLALIELHDPNIAIDSIQNKVKAASQYFRFTHKRERFDHYQDKTVFDIESSAALEKSMGLKSECGKVLSTQSTLKDAFKDNLYSTNAISVEKDITPLSYIALLINNLQPKQGYELQEILQLN